MVPSLGSLWNHLVFCVTWWKPDIFFLGISKRWTNWNLVTFWNSYSLNETRCYWTVGIILMISTYINTFQAHCTSWLLKNYFRPTHFLVFVYKVLAVQVTSWSSFLPKLPACLLTKTHWKASFNCGLFSHAVLPPHNARINSNSKQVLK